MPETNLSGISSRFQLLSQADGQIAYVLLTRSPLLVKKQAPLQSVRLACIRHAASVHPEPGSNSPFVRVCLARFISSVLRQIFYELTLFFVLFFLFSFQRSTPSREVLTYITKPIVFCQQLFKVFSFFCRLFASRLDSACLKFVTTPYFQGLL